MAELGTSRGSGLFQDWYDRYVKPNKRPMEGIFSGRKPDFSLGVPPSTNPLGYRGPGITAPTTFPVSATPTPEVPGAIPPAPVDPVDAESAALDAAAGNQDGGWTGPTPGPPTAAPSLTDRFNAGISRVGEGLKDPAKMGLLTAGLSMMATPPRAVPYSNAEIIGQAGLTGVKFYEQALEAKRKDEMMKQTAEEHALTREDRRQANLDRAEYYRSTADTRALNASTLEDLRKVNADAKISLDKPIPDSLAKTYNLPIGTTIRDYKQMEPGLIASAKPEKVAKTDPFTEWYNSFGEAGPTRKQLEGWHRSQGAGGGTDSGPGKVGQTGQVNRELVAMYLPYAKAALEAKGPAGMEEYKGMVAMFQTTDQFGGTVNDARLREALPPEIRKEYDAVKRRGQDHGRTMTPANAIARAQEEWKAKNPGAPATTKPLPPGAVRKIIKGKSYIKTVDGKVYAE